MMYIMVLFGGNIVLIDEKTFEEILVKFTIKYYQGRFYKVTDYFGDVT